MKYMLSYLIFQLIIITFVITVYTTGNVNLERKEQQIKTLQSSHPKVRENMHGWNVLAVFLCDVYSFPHLLVEGWSVFDYSAFYTDLSIWSHDHKMATLDVRLKKVNKIYKDGVSSFAFGILKCSNAFHLNMLNYSYFYDCSSYRIF